MTLVGLGGVVLLAGGIWLGQGLLGSRPAGLQTSVTVDGSVANFKITDTHPDALDVTSITDTLLAGSIDCATYDTNVMSSVHLSVYPSGADPADIENFKESVGESCSGMVPSDLAPWAITVAWGGTGMASEAYTG